MSATDRPVHASDPSEHLVIVADELLSVGALMALVADADDSAVVVMMGESDPMLTGGLITGLDAMVSVSPVTDAIKQVDADGLIVATIDRNELRILSTPLMIRVGSLRHSLRGRPAAEMINPTSLVTPDLIIGTVIE